MSGRRSAKKATARRRRGPLPPDLFDVLGASIAGALRRGVDKNKAEVDWIILEIVRLLAAGELFNMTLDVEREPREGAWSSIRISLEGERKA